MQRFERGEKRQCLFGVARFGDGERAVLRIIALRTA